MLLLLLLLLCERQLGDSGDCLGARGETLLERSSLSMNFELSILFYSQDRIKGVVLVGQVVLLFCCGVTVMPFIAS